MVPVLVLYADVVFKLIEQFVIEQLWQELAPIVRAVSLIILARLMPINLNAEIGADDAAPLVVHILPSTEQSVIEQLIQPFAPIVPPPLTELARLIPVK